MANTMLDSIKRFTGVNDTLQDELLQEIILESRERILDYINQDGITNLEVVPSSLDYVVRDVSIKRFNRLNSEGAAADSEEGKSTTWESGYLSEYATTLDRYRKKKGGRGIAMFL